MVYLLIVSFIWAFSFGLIKGNLAGLDSNLVAFIRMAISLLVFAPFLRWKQLGGKVIAALMVIGVVQYGLMYISYIYSYRFLKAHMIALFTIFTPLYVTLINDLLDRRFRRLFLVTALLAIVGTGVITWVDIHMRDLRVGFLLIQVANVCFAFGQVAYRRLMISRGALKDYQVFGFLYLGAVLITGLAACVTVEWSAVALTAKQVLTLLYLGVLASGICFFLWNYGARRTDTGALAIMNNLKVPLAIACSLIFFGEDGNVPRLLVGGGIILAALFVNEFLLKRVTPTRAQGADS